MAYVAPSSKSDGDTITSAIWNQDVVDNIKATLVGVVDGAGQVGYSTSSTEIAKLAAGTDKQSLAMSGTTAIQWVDSPNSLMDAKGEILGASAANTLGALSTGTDTHVLNVDSGEALGIKWAAAAGGSQELKAWLCWSNVGTNTLKDSFNVTSVTDGGGTAETDVLWDTDFANANYAMAGISEGAQWGTHRIVVYTPSTKLVGGVEIVTVVGTNPAGESPDIGLGAWGDQ